MDQNFGRGLLVVAFGGFPVVLDIRGGVGGSASAGRGLQVGEKGMV